MKHDHFIGTNGGLTWFNHRNGGFHGNNQGKVAFIINTDQPQ